MAYITLDTLYTVFFYIIHYNIHTEQLGYASVTVSVRERYYSINCHMQCVLLYFEQNSMVDPTVAVEKLGSLQYVALGIFATSKNNLNMCIMRVLKL